MIELANFGTDQHDLRLQRVGSRHIAGLGVVAPGTQADLSLKLAPGRYLLWCSVANHRALWNAGDARRHALSLDDVGDPNGAPVVYLHGGGDSRLSRHPDDRIAAALGVRLLAVDRCGLGRARSDAARLGRAVRRRVSRSSGSA